MPDDSSLLIGLMVGLLAGVSIGWLLAQALSHARREPSSVVFDRDSEGRITAIHYVPVGAG